MESNFSGYWKGKINAKNGVIEIEFKEVVVSSKSYFKTFSYLFLDLNKIMDLMNGHPFHIFLGLTFISKVVMSLMVLFGFILKMMMALLITLLLVRLYHLESG